MMSQAGGQALLARALRPGGGGPWPPEEASPETMEWNGMY
jgi:hypothetical protein